MDKVDGEMSGLNGHADLLSWGCSTLNWIPLLARLLVADEPVYASSIRAYWESKIDGSDQMGQLWSQPGFALHISSLLLLQHLSHMLRYWR